MFLSFVNGYLLCGLAACKTLASEHFVSTAHSAHSLILVSWDNCCTPLTPPQRLLASIRAVTLHQTSQSNTALTRTAASLVAAEPPKR